MTWLYRLFCIAWGILCAVAVWSVFAEDDDEL